ncbi:TRAP transporter small permease [Verrucomicrobiaceae bacterium R5-34]|uniref:TRAP transporter small permease n=1 Tax=Oceaniferula flava TaxID=2800421 RepID=A0AAE2VCZ3_9BACT|nr:TRAP transporter small permease [Oceaniferula flavus]MBK1831034.1 TRAP transporter small permease [Verrucomicrobiaceae bacterium R5-34]MBK1855551.1 TRAP transporter small permease [Oceaniferula flavus]MBM1136857.1 TRAP transporter small permease [Oceaniferula flavus]
MLSLLTKSLKCISAACLVVLLLAVLLGILSARLGLGIAWTTELAEFLLVWTVMFGGALAYLEHSHLGVDILVNHTDDGTRKFTAKLSHLLIALFALLVMVIGGFQLFQARWESAQVLPALGIRKAWFYFAVPVSGCLIFLTAILYLGKKPTPNP